jgi:hypothetical protein
MVSVFAGIGVLTIAGVITLALFFRSQLPRKHSHVTTEQLRNWLQIILTGGRGSTVFILAGRDRSLQLEVQPVGGENQIVLLYPKTQWSSPYFAAVSAKANLEDLPTWQTAAGEKRTFETLWVSFGRNADQATSFSVSVITNIYGASLEADCQAMVRKVARFADAT